MRRFSKALSFLLTISIFIFAASSCKEDKKEFTVTFNSNGGSEVSARTVEEGDTLYKPRNPEKNGYVFDAWYYDDQKWNFSTQPITEDITLVAKWFMLPADGIAYILNDDYSAYHVSDYLGDDLNVIIASTYRGLPVVKIDDWAFASTNIKTIKIPNSITEIGNNSFDMCDWLESVELPSSIVSIGGAAFENCDRLSELNIPQNVKSIGDSVLARCPSLRKLSVDSANEYYDSRNDCNAIIETKSNKIIAGCRYTIIPNTVTTIGQSAFSRAINMFKITIPSSVTTIEYFAFSESGLQYIYIPNTVKVIEHGAFEDCLNLTIYCEVNSRPQEWHEGWNSSHNHVIWGHKEIT